MIQLNPDYEAIFPPNNIDDDCDSIAHKIDVVGLQIKELLKIASEIDDGNVGLYKMAVTKYLQLLKSMTKHFVEDKHWCYFHDWYSPDYSMKLIYDAIMKHDIDAESQALLEEGHKEILQSECYEDYGCPSYIDR